MSKQKRKQKNRFKKSSPTLRKPMPEPLTNIPTTKKGIYTEYLDRQMTVDQLAKERKLQLQTISDLREGRAVLVYAADFRKNIAPISIDYSDLTPINDQISVLEGSRLDLILETMGGLGEVAEDIVKLLRSRFDEVNVIIPGTAKSAGTLIAMAGDDILMEQVSSLGPIDAQIIHNGKQFSAEAFISWLDDVKKEVTVRKELNRAYIPILQSLSPGEIRNAENAMDFAKELVREWLARYKFKNWTHRKRTGEEITTEERKARADKIASELSNHSRWKTHGRSLKIDDLRAMELVITDYSEQPDLADAIRRYKILLELTFQSSNVYKIYETPTSQIMHMVSQQQIAPVNAPPIQQIPQNADSLDLDINCVNCNEIIKIHAGIGKAPNVKNGYERFPIDDKIKCKNCQNEINLAGLRNEIEAQLGKKIV